MDAEHIQALLGRPEDELLEFKREWYTLDQSAGKAEFVKDALAMANGLPDSETGLIVIGVEDHKAGGGVCGVEDTPAEEQLTQILHTYTSPVPRLTFTPAVELRDKVVSVIEVHRDDFHPYYITRDIGGLSSWEVYKRVGSTIARVRPRELEDMIRAKESRLSNAGSGSQLQSGIVEVPRGRGSVHVRLSNPTDEPIDQVTVIFESILVHPTVCRYRGGGLAGAVMKPRESREVSFDPFRGPFFDAQGKEANRGMIWSRWVDVRVHVSYRDRTGYIQVVRHELSLAD